MTTLDASKMLSVGRPHRKFYFGYPCLVSLFLYKVWVQHSPSLGLLTRNREMGQGSHASWTDKGLC